MDLNYIRKINGTYNRDSRTAILNEMIEQYNYANNNVITEFDVLINTEKAKDVFVNDTPRKVLIEYKNDKNNKDSKFFVQLRNHIGAVKAGDIISFTNIGTGNLDYYINTSKPMTERGYDVNYIRHCNQIVNVGDGITIPAIVEGESYGVKINATNEFISEIDTKVKMTIQNNEINREKIKPNTRICFGRSKYGIYMVGDIVVYQEGVLVCTCKKDKYKEGLDDVENGICWQGESPAEDLVNEYIITGDSDIKVGNSKLYSINSDETVEWNLDEYSIGNAEIELSDNGVLLKAIKVNELVTLTASINNEIVASKDILIVR